jgi:hypothetical protein
LEPLKHETCLYIGTHEGQKIICCRQSDDFLFGGEDEVNVRRLIVKLGLTVAIKAEEGLTTHFNGLEIVQDRDYIHIHVAPYLDKILANHGWYEEGKQETRLVDSTQALSRNSRPQKAPKTLLLPRPSKPPQVLYIGTASARSSSPMSPADSISAIP